MRSFDFYEFTSYLLPGVILLVSLGQVPEVVERAPYLVPQAAGEFGLHLILAYIAGHFVQIIGQVFESSIWWILGGLPTDKPFKKQSETRYKSVFDQLVLVTGGGDVTDKSEWGRRVAIWRSSANRTTGATRLNIFNGSYGMFRGFFTVGAISLSFVWLTEFNTLGIYTFFVLFVIGAAWRMRHFGHRYATELFAIAQQSGE